MMKLFALYGSWKSCHLVRDRWSTPLKRHQPQQLCALKRIHLQAPNTQTLESYENQRLAQSWGHQMNTSKRTPSAVMRTWKQAEQARSNGILSYCPISWCHTAASLLHIQTTCLQSIWHQPMAEAAKIRVLSDCNTISWLRFYKSI